MRCITCLRAGGRDTCLDRPRCLMRGVLPEVSYLGAARVCKTCGGPAMVSCRAGALALRGYFCGPCALKAGVALPLKLLIIRAQQETRP